MEKTKADFESGKHKPNLEFIWEVKRIKVGNSQIKLVCDANVPREEIWFVDTDNDIRKFRMVQIP